ATARRSLGSARYTVATAAPRRRWRSGTPPRVPPAGGRSLGRMPAAAETSAPTAGAPAALRAIGTGAALSEGDVRAARVRSKPRRNLRIVEATVTDGSGPMKAIWFNQAWVADQLRPGTHVLIHGRLDHQGFRVDAHEPLDGGERRPQGLHTTGIVPVHP